MRKKFPISAEIRLKRFSQGDNFFGRGGKIAPKMYNF